MPYSYCSSFFMPSRTGCIILLSVRYKYILVSTFNSEFEKSDWQKKFFHYKTVGFPFVSSGALRCNDGSCKKYFETKFQNVNENMYTTRTHYYFWVFIWLFVCLLLSCEKLHCPSYSCEYLSFHFGKFAIGTKHGGFNTGMNSLRVYIIWICLEM